MRWKDVDGGHYVRLCLKSSNRSIFPLLPNTFVSPCSVMMSRYVHSTRLLVVKSKSLAPQLNVLCFLPSPMKVFDMGLAKELNDTHKPDKDGLYNLTGMTGSPRYMVSSFTLHSV